jgi:hypothetical protein
MIDCDKAVMAEIGGYPNRALVCQTMFKRIPPRQAPQATKDQPR